MILGGLLAIPIRSTSGYYAAPSWTAAALSILYGGFGLYATIKKRPGAMKTCAVLYKVYLVCTMIVDLVSVGLQIWLIADIEWFRRRVLADGYFFDVKENTDNEIRGILIGLLVGYILIRSISYIAAYFILGSMKSIQAVYRAGGKGNERLNYRQIEKEHRAADDDATPVRVVVVRTPEEVQAQH